MVIRNTAIHVLVLIGTLGWAGTALGQDKVHNYLNDTALKVQATENPVEKREILKKSLSDMTRAIETAKNGPLTSEQDDVNLDRLKATLQEKSDELAGVNGFDRVPDDQLNAFSTYVVQDMEQADKNITVSLVVVLLVIIIIILIV